MDRIEFNVLTGQRTVVTLTPQEETAALAQQALADADNTPDKKAGRAIDSLDKVILRRLFNFENRIRTLEGRPLVLAADYRQSLIDDWKALNP